MSNMISIPGHYNRLLILGNGFDLACGLPTKYQDFFNERFGINLYCNLVRAEIDLKNDPNNILPNILSFPDIKKDGIYGSVIERLNNFFLNNLENQGYSLETMKRSLSKWFENIHDEIDKGCLVNKDSFDSFEKQYSELQKKYSCNEWDYIFLLAKLCLSNDSSSIQWYEIESLIEKVVKIIFNHSNSLVYLNNQKKDLFEEYLYHTYRQSKSPDRLAMHLLSNLKIFEHNFSNYVFNLLNDANKTEIYYERVKALLEALIDIKNIKNDFVEQIDIFSFNYTLDVRFLDWLDDHQSINFNNIRISSWTNVHGICSATDANSKNYIIKTVKKFFRKNINFSASFPKIIFGIDNEAINQSADRVNTDDPIRFFTKGVRNAEDNTRIIKCGQLSSKYNTLTIMGHSLNIADYSYFKNFIKIAIKDNAIIEYYYYQDRLTAADHLHRLLNRYGNEIHYQGNLFDDLYNDNKIILKKDPSISIFKPNFKFSE